MDLGVACRFSCGLTAGGTAVREGPGLLLREAFVPGRGDLLHGLEVERLVGVGGAEDGGGDDCGIVVDRT